MSSDRIPIIRGLSLEFHLHKIIANNEHLELDDEISPVYSELDPRIETGRSIPRVPVQDSVESTDLPQLKVYKRRWYILALFCGLACHQCIVWNTFGPIETAVEYAYGWPDSTGLRFRSI